MKNLKNRKILIIGGIVLVTVSILFVGKVAIDKYKYAPIVVEKTYTQPAKEEIRTKDTTLNLFVGDEEIDENNDGKPDFSAVEVGQKGLVAGTYTIDDVELDKYCSLMLRDKNSDNMFDGDQYYKGDIVRLTENDELSAFNCGMHNGGLNVKLSSKGKVTQEASPEQEITETVVLYPDELLNGESFWGRYDTEFFTYWKNGDEVSRKDLKYYSELADEAYNELSEKPLVKKEYEKWVNSTVDEFSNAIDTLK